MKVHQDRSKANYDAKLLGGVEELPELKAYTVLCWYHLRNIWIKDIDDELSKYLVTEFKEELLKSKSTVP